MTSSTTKKSYVPLVGSSLSKTVSAVDLQREQSSFSSFADLKKGNSILSPALNSLDKYNLNLPENDDDAWKLLNDENSPYFACKKTKDYNPKTLLPYKTESLRDQAIYLSHIMTNIYASAKSLDLKGSVSVSAEELLQAKKELKSKYALASDIAIPNDDMLDSTSIDVDEIQTDYSDDEEESDDDDDDDDDGGFVEPDDEDIAVEGTPINKFDENISPLINLKNWTKELNTLLSNEFPIPISCAAALVKVYYSIVLSRGQNINIRFYIETIRLLLDQDMLLYDSGLTLDWRPLHEEALYIIHTSDSAICTNTQDHTLDILAVGQCVSKYFDKKELPEMIESIVSRYKYDETNFLFNTISSALPIAFDVPTVNKDGSVTYLPTDIRHYFPIFFNMWSNHFHHQGVHHIAIFINNCADQYLYDISKHPEWSSTGDYGMLTKDQFNHWVTRVVNCLTRPGAPTEIHYYIMNLIQLICYSLTSQNGMKEDGVFDKLASIFTPLKRFAHPSSDEQRQVGVSIAVSSMCSSIYSRRLRESKNKEVVADYLLDLSILPESLKLSDEILDRLIDLLLPLINLGVQSKSSSTREKYTRCLKYLTFLRPEKILDTVLLDIYTTFESVNSTHRLTTVFVELEALVRFMVEKPVYRIHVPRLLSMLVPGIDTNDAEKTIRTIHLVQVVASVIPFVDLSEGEGDGGYLAIDFTSQHLAYLEAKMFESSPSSGSNTIYSGPVPEKFEYDPELELEALKSASSTFADFIRIFCDGCFKYLENSPDVQEDTEIESRASMIIPRAFDALIESLSDDIFYILADKIFQYVSENVKHQVGVVFTELCSLIIRRCPEKYFDKFYKFFLSQVKEEIRHGAGKSRDVVSKDARLVWYTKLLSGTCHGAGSYIIPYISELQQFVSATMIHMKGEASISFFMLIQSYFHTISTTRILERRLISDSYIKKHGINEKCWGAFQFTPERLNTEYLDFKWYIPDKTAIDTAANNFELLSLETIEKINKLINEDLAVKSNLSHESLDQLTALLDIFQGALVGTSLLFDPNYKNGKSIHGIGNRVTVSGDLLSTSSSIDTLAKSNSKGFFNAHESSSDNGAPLTIKTSTSPSSDADVTMDKIITGEVDSEEMFDSPTASEGFAEDGNIQTPYADSVSGLDTPSFGHVLSSDPLLTNRPSSLYNFGYYFDRDQIVNQMDPSYIKLHKAREKIGECLLALLKFLMNKDGTFRGMHSTIRTVGIWLSRCGQFSSHSAAYMQNSSISNLLDMPLLKKTNSRFITGARLSVLHFKRINMVRSLRSATELDRSLLKALVSICASPYEENLHLASAVLVKTFGKVMGGQKLILGIFHEWELALSKKNVPVLKNITSFFNKKKMKGIAEGSPKHLLKYEDMLIRTSLLDDEDLNQRALKLYLRIKSSLKVPERVCLVDWSAIDAIKPVDEANTIEGNIQALILAKSKKRDIYYDLATKFETRVLERITTFTTQWKFTYIALETLEELQLQVELPLSGDALKVITKNVLSHHPGIRSCALESFSSVLNFAYFKARLGYKEEELMKLYPNFKHMITLKEAMGDDVTAADVIQEFRKIENPKFFVDNRCSLLESPFLNKNYLVVSNAKVDTLYLNDADEQTMKELSSLIDKNFFMNMVKGLLDTVEDDTRISMQDIRFISHIHILSAHGYLQRISYQDIIDIVGQIYSPEHLHTHIIVMEIFAGLLISAKSVANFEPVDRMIAKWIDKIFSNDLSEGYDSVWAFFCSWVPSMADYRRFPLTTMAICNFEISTEEESSSSIVNIRLSLLQGFLYIVRERFYNYDNLVERLFKALPHPYDNVASSVAVALTYCFHHQASNCYSDYSEYYQKIILADASGLRHKEYGTLTPVFKNNLTAYMARLEVMKPFFMSQKEYSTRNYYYSIRGLYRLCLASHEKQTCIVQSGYMAPLIFPLVKDQLFKYLLDLESKKDVSEIYNLHPGGLLLMFSKVRLSDEDEKFYVKLMLNNFNVSSPTVSQSKLMLNAVAFYYTEGAIALTQEEKSTYINYFIKELYSPHIEIRELAAAMLTSFLSSYLSVNTEELTRDLIHEFTRILYSDKKGPSNTVARLHGATLGLASIVSSFIYNTPLPNWTPEVLATIAKKSAGVEGPVGKCAKDVLASFKKARQDTWIIDSRFFTDEQKEDLEGVLWKSYLI